MTGKILKPADNEKPSVIYKNHCNLHLKVAFENIVEYGRFVDFRKVLDAMLRYPYQNFDSFQEGQLKSKKWLIQEMNKMRLKHEPEILIVGGWHGVLTLLLKQYAYFKYTILTTDIDPDCTSIARMLGCVASTIDMFEIEYDIVPADFIINTSCEHIDFDKWIKLIPKDKIVAIQSSDMKWKTHIDNVYSIDEFIERANLSKVYAAKTAKYFDNNRYLLIGRM